MGAKTTGDNLAYRQDFPELCRYVTELSPQPMVALEGPTHIVRYANPAFRKFLRKEHSHLLGCTFADAVPETVANECEALLDRVFTSGTHECLLEQEHHTSPKGETELEHADCFPTHFSYLAWAVPYPAGDELTNSAERPAGVILQVTDATETAKFRKASADMNEALLLSGLQQHELMEALQLSEIQERKARQEAEAANQSKDEFMAVLSHELRTPLNAIMGWAGILTEGACGENDWDEGLAVILRSAGTQLHLIEDMMDITRIASGKLSLDVTPCRLSHIVTAASNIILPAATAKQITLTTDVEPDSRIGYYDEGRMQQVILNLLSNAIKFTAPNGEVTLKLWQEGQISTIEVRDNGVGMSSDVLPYVFDRFRQEDSTSRRRFGGLGLGLSIVKHIVVMHGGVVRAHSAGPGEGSTFTVTLPTLNYKQDETLDTAANQVADTHPSRRPVSASPGTSSELPLSGVAIVTVDDEADALTLMSKILQNAGATVRSASCVETAMELLISEHTHVLISDLGMPGEDGFDLIRRIRSAGYSADQLPAIAVTAIAGNKIEETVLQAGYQMHLPKPVNAPRLIQAIVNVASLKVDE